MAKIVLKVKGMHCFRVRSLPRARFLENPRFSILSSAKNRTHGFSTFSLRSALLFSSART